MDTQKTPHDIERERLQSIRKQHPCLEDKPDGLVGVLLNDQIKDFVSNHGLIGDAHDDCYKPAGYELRVGKEYAMCGEIHSLSVGGKIEIPPYEVAVIQTFETINLPRFIIARWNIKVSWAYEGLLWVGAAQVDPGWIGRLACPVYNLSSKTVSLSYMDPIALIDFVPTTNFNPNSKTYQEVPKRLCLSEYGAERLKSGVAGQLSEFQNKLARFDTYLMLLFAALTIIVAAMALMLDRGAFAPGSVWVVLAFVFAFFAFALSFVSHRIPGKAAAWKVGAGLIVGVTIAGYVCYTKLSARIRALESHQPTAIVSPTGPAQGRKSGL